MKRSKMNFYTASKRVLEIGRVKKVKHFYIATPVYGFGQSGRRVCDGMILKYIPDAAYDRTPDEVTCEVCQAFLVAKSIEKL